MFYCAESKPGEREYKPTSLVEIFEICCGSPNFVTTGAHIALRRDSYIYSTPITLLYYTDYFIPPSLISSELCPPDFTGS